MHRMNNNRRLAISIAALVLVAVAWGISREDQPSADVAVASVDVPIIMHTSGGRLEVATVTNTEAFTLEAPPKSVLGVDLGKTFSHLQVKVIYRYHIEMAKQWPIQLTGSTAIVQAGEIKPTLPVAFDTTTMRKQTESGWARFDKHENLEELERQISPKLESRALGYKNLALESARKSVGDFVRTWLIKEQHLEQGGTHMITVLFPGELAPQPLEEPQTQASQ
jgi:hypothetical protein